MTLQARQGRQRPKAPLVRKGLVPPEKNQEYSLWEHGLHEDGQFIQRGNFFLLAESLLVVSYSGLLAASGTGGITHNTGDHMLLAARIIAVFGLLLTAAWLYVGQRHLTYIRYLQARMRDRSPEYRSVRDGRPRGPVHMFDVITYMIPILAGVLWILFLLIA